MFCLGMPVRMVIGAFFPALESRLALFVAGEARFYVLSGNGRRRSAAIPHLPRRMPALLLPPSPQAHILLSTDLGREGP